MQVDNRLLDDLARLTSGALGSLAGLKEEIDALVRRRLERLLAEMELVRREEFEAVKAVAANARAAQETLEARLARLEQALEEAAPARAKQEGSHKPLR
ncbi:MAG TPA: accessory factor UbiK family protein [Alphaproteobacteria bacterium]|nr:accessory factor UbiK family protein [Alphaproteobacteria bacterium]